MTGEPLPAKYRRSRPRSPTGRSTPRSRPRCGGRWTRPHPGWRPYEVDELEAQVVAQALEGYDPDLFLSWLKKVPQHAHPDGGAPDRTSPPPHLRDAAGVAERVDPVGAGTRPPDRRVLEVRGGCEHGDEAVHHHHPRSAGTRTRHHGSAAVGAAAGGRDPAGRETGVEDGRRAGRRHRRHPARHHPLRRPQDRVRDRAAPDCGTEISASVARMLAADAEIIPVVLGGRSQPLDLGTGRRYFSRAQRRAMVIRDGGCVGPACDAPPGWCDGAHIRPAGYGPTSLENGVLLCWRCHLLLDQHGWQIHRIGDRWWWTPPPWIDPTGRQRPGGRIPPPDPGTKRVVSTRAGRARLTTVRGAPAQTPGRPVLTGSHPVAEDEV